MPKKYVTGIPKKTDTEIYLNILTFFPFSRLIRNDVAINPIINPPVGEKMTPIPP